MTTASRQYEQFFTTADQPRAVPQLVTSRPFMGAVVPAFSGCPCIICGDNQEPCEHDPKPPISVVPVPQAEPAPWHADYGNVVRLADYLVNDRCLNARELLHFLHKPWKWSREWAEMNNGGCHASS